MTGFAMPTTAHNARALTPREYEDLMSPAMPDGVFGHPADQPVVYADGSPLGLKVRANRLIYLRGLRYDTGDVEQSITLAANSTAGTSRKDLIVARMTRNPWDVTIEKVQGAAVANPITPSPNYGGDTSTGVWELPLASATVDYNSTTVTVTPLHWYVGSDGQIRCTTSTYPPREAGRAVWVHPEGRWDVSSGDNWLTAVEDSGPLSVSLLPGYAATENSLQRRNRLCVLNLKVLRTNAAFPAGSTTKVANLPSGFEPTFPVQSAAQVWAQGQPAALRVTSAGVYVVALAGVSVGEDRTVEGSLVWHAA